MPTTTSKRPRPRSQPSRRRTRSRAAEAATPPEKRAHELDGDLLVALEGAGADLDALVGRYVLDSSAVAVLLVGSLAEGVGSPVSDLDLLVLADSPAERQSRAPGLVRSHGAVAEYRVYEQGIELDVEVAFRSEMRRIVGTFLELAPLVYKPEELARLPLLEPTDVRLLHRLRTGIVWRGGDVVAQWRDELYTELLPVYLALVQTVALERRYEEAWAVGEHEGGAIAMAGRRVGEAALLAGLASVGVTNPSVTAAVELARRVEDADARALLDLAVHTMFPPATMPADARLAYLAQLAALRDAVRARVEGDLGLERALFALEAQAPVVLPAEAE